jgi:nucleolar complex protein 3
VVRLLNQVIKARRFNVDPNLLTCLLHLRLKTELNVRASKSKADKNQGVKPYSKRRAAERRARGKSTDQPHLSKKMKKALKEKKDIDKEFREAEAEVDKEERDNTVRHRRQSLYAMLILSTPSTLKLSSSSLFFILES